MRIRTCFAVTLAITAGVVAPLLVNTAANASTSTAEVTVVHGIPKTPVDVYLDGKLALNDFVFGTVTKPIALAPGSYSVAIRPHAASSTSAPILSTTVKVTAGENAAIVANLTATGSPTLNVFGDPTSSLPMGDARVIVRHLADAPGVDVYAGNTKVASDLTNPLKATLVIPAGKVTVRVDVTGTTTTVIGPASFDFKAGTTTVIYAIGSATGKTLTVAVQTYSS